MVRTIIIPETQDLHILINKEYIGKRLEITYFSLDEIEEIQTPKLTMSSFWNVLSDNSAEELRKASSEIRNNWE